MPNQFSAGPQALGYLYQIRYALLLLLREIRTRPDCRLTIEQLDDVAFEREGTAYELIQTKHHLDHAAALNDSSPDLWKTLRVWCVHLRDAPQGTPLPILSLITTSTADDGSATSKLREGNSRDEEGALRILRDVAERGSNREMAPAYVAFLGLDIALQQALISRVRVIDATPNILDVETKIHLELTTSTKYYKRLSEGLEGWWFNRAIINLRNSPEDTISGQELVRQIYSLQSQLQDDNLPNDFPEFAPMDESDLPDHQRVFVEQLRLVLNNKNRLHSAIGHYYRAYRQRAKWLEDGLIFPDELEQYERNLEMEWSEQFERMRDEMGDLPSEDEMRRLGLKLFEWANFDAQYPIRPRHVNSSFMRGTFHSLANEMRIGWHTEFQERLAHLMVAGARIAS